MSFIREPNAEPIPGYRIIEPLGSGGFGEVWKCEAPGGIFKAIKFVYGNLNSLDVDGARAEQELKALNRVKEIRHPFILQMDRIEVVAGELVIVMELADRCMHDAFVESQQAGMVGIPRDVLLRYVRDAAEALDHMNEKYGLQHLDIKPRNLFLVSDRVKIADFGLVKTLERTGNTGGLSSVTPLYAPPETFGGTISGRSDQYSLAIVYQEMLTGQRPFKGKNVRQLAQAHMNEEPEVRLLPEAERPVVARALAKDPAKRFPNCIAFVRALYTAQAARPEPLVAQAPSTGTNRPVTMSDTMEDVFLEQMPPDGTLVPVDLDPEVVAEATRPTVKPDADAESLAEVSQLGMTVAQPSTGALKPTVVIGVGAFGRRAMLELRCRLLDRFGDLDRMPLVRFLYVDTDADAIRRAVHGAPEIAFKAHEVYPLTLQPIAHYRKGQLDQLAEWLPREKLYALPRSLQTQGSRSLGRLAFTDHYRRVLARLKREIEAACDPDNLYRAVSQTGLALRDSVPRVYVVGSAVGGASGYLADLGYAVRRLLKQMRHAESAVTALLFCGAPDDPATPRPEQANLYATLTELNHFADPATAFAARYGSDGQRLVDEASAYDDTYLVTLNYRTPEGRRDAMGHLGSYLFHELTTPLGIRLEHCRRARPAGGAPFRSLGTYGVWFPRGLLLRLAARSACGRLIEYWQQPGETTAQAELQAAVARTLSDPEFRPDALASRITAGAAVHLESAPADALTGLLAALEEQTQQSVAQDDVGGWARQALQKVKDWLGSGIQPTGAPTVAQRKSRVTRALETAVDELARVWDERLTAAAVGLMEHPGRRVAAAEAGLTQFAQACLEAGRAHAERIRQQALVSRAAQQQLNDALELCLSGGNSFSWFGSRSRRQLRLFMDHLAAYARQCLAEDVVAAVQSFYTTLSGRIDDRLRDLSFCRQRLRGLQEALEAAPDSAEAAAPGELSGSPTPLASAESYWDVIRESATNRVVLPDLQGTTAKAADAWTAADAASVSVRPTVGEADLERAARHFLETLTDDHWLQLDQVLQDQVLGPRGGLASACLAGDLVRHLATPLVDAAADCMGTHLPITDVADVELADSAALAERVHEYHTAAAPLLRPADRTEAKRPVEAGRSSGNIQLPGKSAPGRTPPRDDTSFLLVPASEAGKRYAEAARTTLPGLQLVNVSGQADLVFCREQGGLSYEDLERLLKPCKVAYEEVAHVPATSPHARFDIVDWTPLDP